jgi:hypothetical protein
MQLLQISILKHLIMNIRIMIVLFHCKIINKINKLFKFCNIRIQLTKNVKNKNFYKIYKKIVIKMILLNNKILIKLKLK